MDDNVERGLSFSNKLVSVIAVVVSLSVTIGVNIAQTRNNAKKICQIESRITEFEKFESEFKEWKKHVNNELSEIKELLRGRR